jgi:hypothetical protein
MSRDRFDIRDDEFRVIGAKGDSPEAQPVPSRKQSRGIMIGVIVIVLLLAPIMVRIAVLAYKAANRLQEEVEEVVFDPMTNNSTIDMGKKIEPLGNYTDTTSMAYTEHLQETINDIPLDIYIPHNAVPELRLGIPSLHDRSIVLTTQAADIRADNGKIVGAFVLRGKPLSWGLSKKGYCGIIDGKITVGVADNSPLFEEATEKDGYFFRQYPLVDNGVLVENEPKGKSIRKALCDRNGEIMVIMTKTPESFHDFSQALVDLQVDNAIYLVGSTSYGYFRDRYDQMAIIYNKYRYGYENENFIVWRKTNE